MLRIQNTQLVAMRNQRLMDFQRRLETHLLQFFPAHEMLSQPHWAQQFQLIMQRCRRYQLRSEVAIMIFFNATCCLGPGFESGNKLQFVLTNKYLPESDKTAGLIADVEKKLQASSR